MSSHNWFGLFSPAVSDERAVGLPVSVRSFSEQLKYLNNTVLLPHKENGEMSDLLYFDRLFVCKVNSKDELRVTDRVVLFPTTSQQQQTPRFPLLMTEKSAKKHILRLFLRALTGVWKKDAEENNAEEEEENGAFLDLFDIENRLEVLGMYINVLTLSKRFSNIITSKVQEWWLQNQHQISDSLAEKIRETLTEASNNRNDGGGRSDDDDNGDRATETLEATVIIMNHLLNQFKDFYELLHIKPIGVVMSLLENDRNYATQGDLIHVKLT